MIYCFCVLVEIFDPYWDQERIIMFPLQGMMIVVCLFCATILEALQAFF